MSLSRISTSLLASPLVLLVLCAPNFATAQSINFDEATNTAFMTVDEPFGGTADLALRFGGTLQEYLKFDRSSDRFEFSDDVFVEGNLAAGNGLYGETLSLSGSMTTVNGVSYQWPSSPADFSGKVLKVDPSSGQLSWSDTDVIVRKTANESVNNSNAFQDDDHLSLYIPANETWLIRFFLAGSSGTTPDFKFQLRGQSGSSCRFTIGDIEGATSASVTDCDDAPASTGSIAGNGNNAESYQGWAIYTQGSTAGTVTLWWAQNTANASNTTLYSDSFLMGRRIE